MSLRSHAHGKTTRLPSTEKTTSLPSTEPRKVNILCLCKSRSITPTPAQLEQPTSNHHKLSTKPPQITTKNPPSHPEHRRTTTRFSPPRHPCSFSSSSSPLPMPLPLPLPLLLSFCFHPERSEGPRRSLPHPYQSSLFKQNLHPLPLPLFLPLLLLLLLPLPLPLPLLLSFCCHPERSEGPRRSLPHPYRSSLFNQNLYPLLLPLPLPLFLLLFLPLGRGGFNPASKTRREATSTLPKAGAKAKPQRLNLLPLLCRCLFLPFALRRRIGEKPVKPQTLETPCQSSKIAWRSSSPPTAILDTEEKESPERIRGFSL